MKQLIRHLSLRRGSRSVLSLGLVLLLLLTAGALWYGWNRSTPAQLEHIYQLGLQAARESNLGAVQAASEALSGIEQTEAQMHVLEGFLHLRAGRLREAVADLQQGLSNPETAPIANMWAGEALYRNRQFQEAIEALRAALQQDDQLVDAHRRLAAVLFDIGTTEEAVVHLRKVSQLDPRDPRPHRLMGLIYKDMESFDKAIPEYQEALRRAPTLPEREAVVTELATCFLRQHDFQSLEEIAATAPVSADILAMQAESQFEQGHAEPALALANEALSLKPEHLEALLMKGTIQLSQGSTDQAVETLKKTATLYPVDYRVRHKLAQAYSRLGQVEQAQTEAAETERLRELRSRFADLHGRASVNPHDADLRYQLGLLARELQREDLAVSWFAAATALDPNHSAAQEALQASSPRQTQPLPPDVPPSTEPKPD